MDEKDRRENGVCDSVKIPENMELTYEVLNSRHVSNNELMWQTPVLAVTAMAFLLTIAFGEKTPAWAQVISSLLSAATAFASIQLMLKHSYNERKDSEILEKLEIQLRLWRIHPKQRPSPDKKRFCIKNLYDFLEVEFARMQSRQIWLMVLTAFGAFSLLKAACSFLLRCPDNWLGRILQSICLP